MTKFAVTVEGQKYAVEAPDENTAWAWANHTHRESSQRRRAPDVPAFEREAADIASRGGADFGTWLAGTKPMRFAAGAADPFIGAAQLGANALGMGDSINDWVRRRDEQIQQGRRANESEGFDWTRLGGNILSPAALKVMQIAPAASAGGRIAQGAAIGAGTGATTPVTSDDNFWGPKAAQTGAGAAIGALIPGAIDLVGKGARIGRNVIDPWLPGGVERAAGRTANAAAGPDQPNIVQALQKARQIVPGSAPTSGEAAAPVGRAEFSGLQEAVRGRAPTPFDAVTQAQNEARVRALQGIGQNKAALTAAESQRGANAATNYADAYAQHIRSDPQLARLFTNPFLKDEVPAALKLAEANGISPKQDLTQFLHYVKIGLDKQLSKTGNDALSSTQQKAVADAKTALVSWLAKANPKYDAARATFAAESAPINQMQVGQFLEQKLTPALNDQAPQRAAMYAQALRDAPGTLKRATGQPRYDELGEVLTPQQLGAAQNVGRDLSRSAEHGRLASLGMERARDLVGQVAPKVPAAGMFSPHYSVMRAIGNRLAGRVEGKSLDMLADLMRDPQRLAKVMQSATPSQQAQIAQYLLTHQGGRAATIAGSLGAAQGE